ncbi:50S ribosomal subunit protein L16 [Candidatus Tremblaya phenacola PAVE]|nr:50S ribosomal subunit protein L16 [Candidatus Tremblaya phenacola PAVE]
MLQPKKRKYRKEMKNRNRGTATKGCHLSFGMFGLKATSRGRLTSKQIEAARRAMTHHIKRLGRVLIRIFPDKPVTKKPAEVRMGSGKGAVDHFVFEVKPGKILYEIDGVETALANEAMRLASNKLPLKTVLISKRIDDNYNV